jgi:hypothetical protein
MSFDDTNTLPSSVTFFMSQLHCGTIQTIDYWDLGELLAGEIWSDTVVVWLGAKGEREEGEYKRRTFFIDTMKTTFSTEYLTLFIKNKMPGYVFRGFLCP